MDGLSPESAHAHNRTMRAELGMLRAELPPDYARVVLIDVAAPRALPTTPFFSRDCRTVTRKP